MIIKWLNTILFTLLITASGFVWSKRIVNVYVWGGVIPNSLIQKFEKETGIKVHFSTYDSNETMYTRLKASQKGVYDIILPSAYYVERMKKQNLIIKLDKTKIPNLKNLDPGFQNNPYDPHNNHSVPLTWGATGIFYNSKWINYNITSWQDLWLDKWKNQLLLLDDPREVFSGALLSLGFNPNDNNPVHIKKAYEKLLQLIPNIKLFASDNLQSILIDEDALLGITWNGDAFKAYQENSAINFIYPKEGFVMWVDCLAIPAKAPHLNEAYEFINFFLNGENAKIMALKQGYAITNRIGKDLLPDAIKKNQMVYPSDEIIKKGYFQRDVQTDTIVLFNKYWEQLKLAM